MVATSNTYQLRSVAIPDENKLTSADYVFTGMVIRRMSAEQFADAVGKFAAPMFSDSMMKYKPQANGAEFVNAQTGPRASLVVNNVFLTALGRPNRETVTTSRESEANLLQALELTNGARFSSTLTKGAQRWMNQYTDPQTMVREIYRQALGRIPTDDEKKIAAASLGSNPTKELVEDLLWSVMLLPEFQLIY
jgi:hypothetical protein